MPVTRYCFAVASPTKVILTLPPLVPWPHPFGLKAMGGGAQKRELKVRIRGLLLGRALLRRMRVGEIPTLVKSTTLLLQLAFRCSAKESLRTASSCGTHRDLIYRILFTTTTSTNILRFRAEAAPFGKRGQA